MIFAVPFSTLTFEYVLVPTVMFTYPVASLGSITTIGISSVILTCSKILISISGLALLISKEAVLLDVSKLVFPLYVTFIIWFPAVKLETIKVATVLVSLTGSYFLPSISIVTFPVAPGVTLTFIVAFSP